MQGSILLAARCRQPTCRRLYGSLSKRSYRQHARQVHNPAPRHPQGNQTAGSEFHVAITSSIHTSAGGVASTAEHMPGSRDAKRGEVQQLAAQAFQTLLDMNVVSAGLPAPAMVMMAVPPVPAPILHYGDLVHTPSQLPSRYLHCRRPIQR